MTKESVSVPKQTPLLAGEIPQNESTKGSAVEIPQPLHAWAVQLDNLPSLNNKLPQNLSACWCSPLRPDFDRQFPRAEGSKNRIEVTLCQQSMPTTIYMQKQKFLS